MKNIRELPLKSTEVEKITGEKILIIKPSSLGDIIHTLPVAHAIKRGHPDCHLGWLVQKPFRTLLERDPAVDEVIALNIPSTSEPGAGFRSWLLAGRATFTTLLELRRRFKRDPFDLVLDLQASFRSALISQANPGGFRVGFADAREGNSLIQDHRIEVTEPRMHALDKNLLFCSYLECTVLKDDFFLPFNHDDELAAGKFLRSYVGKIVSNKKIIYFNPAARWETKFWQPEKWALLGDRLAGELDSLVILAGGRGDRNYLMRIAGYMKERAAVTAGDLSLAGIAALMARTSVYVGLDSGPMHMAAMAGVPVAALFGPTNPELVKPYGVAHRIIRNEGMDCLGCRKRSCETLTCMKGITVDQVHEAVLELANR